MTVEVMDAKVAMSSSLTPSESLASYSCIRWERSSVGAFPCSVKVGELRARLQLGLGPPRGLTGVCILF